MWPRAAAAVRAAAGRHRRLLLTFTAIGGGGGVGAAWVPAASLAAAANALVLGTVAMALSTVMPVPGAAAVAIVLAVVAGFCGGQMPLIQAGLDRGEASVIVTTLYDVTPRLLGTSHDVQSSGPIVPLAPGESLQQTFVTAGDGTQTVLINNHVVVAWSGWLDLLAWMLYLCSAAGLLLVGVRRYNGTLRE